MGIRWSSRRGGSMSRLVGSLTAFALAVGLIVAAPGMSGEAQAVNFDEKCSLTIAPVGEESEYVDDISEANVVVDIYKVADAVPVSGYDTYTYNFGGAYKELQDAYANANERPDNDTWKSMAQAAAKVVLGAGSTTELVKKGASINTKVDTAGCGLYLLIARGSDMEDAKEYMTTVKTESGAENIATIANSKRYVYKFLPELISLPSKQVVDEAGNPVNTTAGNGDWIYNMGVTLKPERAPRFGSLEIVKGLTTYDQSTPAVFVFQVEAMLDGENVYSNVVTISFTEPGEQKVLIEKQIPVGARVTVTEVYSGASYEITSAQEQNATIDAVDVASVTFTNDHSTTTHGGGGVNNHFYNNGDGWNLTDPEPVNDNNGK